MPVGRTPRVSGLQRQVLHFYRNVIRTAREARPAESQQILQFARAEFERYREVDRKNYQLIEHLLRKGTKQLNLLQSTEVIGVQLHRAAAS
ncbi:hypothetical protein WJX72_010302 [[Myrmecia] bisecta]|uniref:Complex 1 LYR protein domain-containing protein n=1 Tax=[Myrmecia] bisecta TaxID=41462 RepID=A0AAW1Q866_9CHLO